MASKAKLVRVGKSADTKARLTAIVQGTFDTAGLKLKTLQGREFGIDRITVVRAVPMCYFQKSEKCHVS